MIDLSTVSFERVLYDGYHIDYVSKLGSIFIDLQTVEVNLCFSRQILAGRPEPFVTYSSTQAAFLQSYLVNALSMNTVIITKLLTTTGSDSLRRFRNEVQRNTRPEYVGALRERYRSTRLAAVLMTDLETLRRVRNDQIAHNSDITLYAGDVSRLRAQQHERLLEAMKNALAATVFSEWPIRSTIDIDSLVIPSLADWPDR